MMGVKIIGTGSAVPSRIMTNDDMAKIVETSDEWISTRTGIRSRRYCDAEAGESHRTLVRDAAERALAAAGIAPAQVGVCLVALDLNAACAGFVYGLHVAECLLPGACRPYALVVGADTLSRVMDFADRTTCVLFGDGAGAAVLECAEGYPELHAVWGSRGDDTSLYAPGVGCDDPSYLHMDGRAVFRFATEVMPRATTEVLERAGISADDVDRFVYHQANKRIVDYSVKKLGLDPAKCEGNIDHTGNTSAGSVPILLDELVRAGELGSGSRVLMAGFGAGLTWAGALAELA